MLRLEASADVADGMPIDAQRFWKTVVNWPLPFEVDDALYVLAPKAWARLEKLAATLLYCWICGDALGCWVWEANEVLPFAFASVPFAAAMAVVAVDALPGVAVNPSCASAAATAAAIWLAPCGDEPLEAIEAGTTNSLGARL